MTDPNDCDNRHRWLNVSVTVILLMMAVLVVIVGWSWVQASSSADKAVNAAEAAVKAANLAERKADSVAIALPYIQDGINDIKQEQSEQRKLLTGLARGGGTK